MTEIRIMVILVMIMTTAITKSYESDEYNINYDSNEAYTNIIIKIIATLIMLMITITI